MPGPGDVEMAMQMQMQCPPAWAMQQSMCYGWGPWCRGYGPYGGGMEQAADMYRMMGALQAQPCGWGQQHHQQQQIEAWPPYAAPPNTPEHLLKAFQLGMWYGRQMKAAMSDNRDSSLKYYPREGPSPELHQARRSAQLMDSDHMARSRGDRDLSRGGSSGDNAASPQPDIDPLEIKGVSHTRGHTGLSAKDKKAKAEAKVAGNAAGDPEGAKERGSSPCVRPHASECREDLHGTGQDAEPAEDRAAKEISQAQDSPAKGMVGGGKRCAEKALWFASKKARSRHNVLRTTKTIPDLF
eukprot:evm.model.scf_75.4 EVM.evm.TU.scf_75.4   scf_75:29503-34450(-)